ncbi:hypothetical protein A3F07_03215 [candidate division WWE3 bacterium RIFCSPHIGHO2_12_FULL_38_15]|uniref:Oxidoreductase molybdopterin-binding domain-containing protein n=1 Tax=candidate division WWE3 bacterium RIFCSPHIGHO2_02_FULL_38_14 TaxID=1802620 RepID=A0A1F4V6M3_UNCKA|nr:MAG: hypothetical protein A2793_03525 [candidate division WWE3 bacterium RIFCSPHIGHO2_01_FULL_38_45]OGC48811.1 MAG: hypothetical protein A3F07_03215 [candidate division WWE3 bacterium RIFCSPHIGHO2_12_FULL_38_15]OGC52766.1 MAG: hypothetical protein A3D91_01900 [candidate division WWE3 bacterium RIFCSPHIGHO2_02_FULL_38_14]OGC53113.1 MAG: hypothetical protein A3B64_01550 [candidate division WWE3 bacterium RIFCSPLOWO2_01_FULL_37_24]HLB51952.1 molybdopterin-dependent oxidoreductase [Patescibacter
MDVISQNYNQGYLNAKLQQASKKFGLTGRKDADSHDRLPPGQYLTQQFPILDLGVRPPLELADFNLKLSGEIENPAVLDSRQFLSLPSQEIKRDFHCVTRWTKYDVTWKGVPFKEILSLAKPKAGVMHVIFESREGYSTNITMEEALKDDVIVAYELEGQPIHLMHGGPVRMIVPQLYGWKSAKFLNAIKFVVKDEPGFWEVRGYNNHADPWMEERYS